MRKQTKQITKESSDKLIKKLVEESDEVRVVREITRLSKSTVKTPIPYQLDKTNYYKV